MAGAAGGDPALPLELANLDLWFSSESEAEQEMTAP